MCSSMGPSVLAFNADDVSKRVTSIKVRKSIVAKLLGSLGEHSGVPAASQVTASCT